jgi:hypothetical protein
MGRRYEARRLGLPVTDMSDYDYAPVVQAMYDEYDQKALLNAGGYQQAMSMTHCLRPVADAVCLGPTAVAAEVDCGRVIAADIS